MMDYNQPLGGNEMPRFGGTPTMMRLPEAKTAEGRRVYALLNTHLPPSTAAKLAAEITGAPRKALYGG